MCRAIARGSLCCFSLRRLLHHVEEDSGIGHIEQQARDLCFRAVALDPAAENASHTSRRARQRIGEAKTRRQSNFGICSKERWRSAHILPPRYCAPTFFQIASVFLISIPLVEGLRPIVSSIDSLGASLTNFNKLLLYFKHSSTCARRVSQTGPSAPEKPAGGRWCKSVTMKA